MGPHVDLLNNWTMDAASPVLRIDFIFHKSGYNHAYFLQIAILYALASFALDWITQMLKNV